MQYRKRFACLAATIGILALSACGSSGLPDHAEITVNAGPNSSAPKQGTSGTASSSKASAGSALGGICGPSSANIVKTHKSSDRVDISITLCVYTSNLWVMTANADHSAYRYSSVVSTLSSTPTPSAKVQASDLEVTVPYGTHFAYVYELNYKSTACEQALQAAAAGQTDVFTISVAELQHCKIIEPTVQ